MNKSKSLFKKILLFLKRIFGKNDTKLLSEGKENLNNSEAKQVSVEKQKIDFITLKNEKDDFFKIYNDIKNGKLKIEELSMFDLIRVNVMLKEEGKILDETLEKFT